MESLKNAIRLGWPILSILLLCSIVSLAIVLQCWSVLRQMRSPGARSDRAWLEEALEFVERRLAVLGTIASSAPFIGLLGTVIGIIRAFQSIAVKGGGGLSTVAGGISEALVATAAGLAVALPASMFFNYLTYSSQAVAKKVLGREAE